MSEENRTAKIEAELEALKSMESVERIPLPWQDSPGHIYPVIKLPLDSVVLNHRSHRIRAQLESSPDRTTVEAAPHSEEAQRVLADLLRATEGFEDLKANLQEVGQTDAGVVTRAGVLVNANTRAVALRDVTPHGYVRVAVLPPNADPKEIAKLELALQMKRDFKQEYTFTNQLLFVEDLKNVFHYNDEDVAKAMNLAASSDERELRKGARQAAQLTRMLALIRELQKRSEGRIPLSFFNDKRQAFIDLDQAYQDLRMKDYEGAERLKEARLLAMLSGTFYRQLRDINETSTVDHVMPALRENPDVGEHLDAIVELDSDDGQPPGLEDLGDEPTAGGDDAKLARLVTLLARSHGEDTVAIPTGEGATQEVDRTELVRNLSESIDDAVEQKRYESRSEKNLNDPIKLVADAKLQVEKALDSYRKVAKNPDFRVGKLAPHVRKLSHAIEALKAEIQKNDT